MTKFTESEDFKLINALSNGTLSKTNYTIESQIKILNINYIPRTDLEIWLDDMTNVFTEDTLEDCKEKLEYITKCLKENVIL